MSTQITDKERAEIAERCKDANARSKLFADIKALENVRLHLDELLGRMRARLERDE